MAIMDELCKFSDAQSLASKSSGSNTDSTYAVDLTGGNKAKDGFGSDIADMINGGVVYFNAQITTVLDCTGSCVLHSRLYAHSGSASFKSGNLLVDLTFPVDAAAGTKRSVAIGPYNVADTERYLGVSYDPVGGTKIVTGNIEAWLSTSPLDTIPKGTQDT